MTRFASITPNLLVRDVKKSTDFYRDVLGFTMGETVPDQEPFVFVWMKRDEVSVFINDIKAAGVNVLFAEKFFAGRHRGVVLHRHRCRRLPREGRAESERDHAAQDAVLRHARIRRGRSRRPHHHVCGARVRTVIFPGLLLLAQMVAGQPATI